MIQEAVSDYIKALEAKVEKLTAAKAEADPEVPVVDVGDAVGDDKSDKDGADRVKQRLLFQLGELEKGEDDINEDFLSDNPDTPEVDSGTEG